ncbi:MAG TPA: TolC family protein [Candidatus Prevotella intestinigallinarum]|nr:TolC family protein [Candidatus Prevotella intestinigallinarum]
MRWIDVMAAAVAAATLSACGIYGRYERPDTGLGTLLRSELAADSTASVGEMGWREVFTDTLLQALIAEGLANNADLATARLKTVEASATLAAARKALLPSASLAATGTLSSHDGAKAQQTYSVGPEVSWEVDIFGKLTNEKRIQAATLEESMAYEQAVQTELVATIACD